MAIAIPQRVKAYDFSYTYQGKTLYYSITDNSQHLVSVVSPRSANYNGYNYVSGILEIPDSVEFNGNMYYVTSIGDNAFDLCGLTSVTIPNRVTSIGNGAFASCRSLTSVALPSGLITIDNHSFFECESLTSITIPDGVTTIGDGAFLSCHSLRTVVIPASVISIGNYAFACYDPMSMFISDENAYSRLTSITIPDGVTSIGTDAFMRVKHIEYHGSATGSPWGAISMNGIIDGDFVFSDTEGTQLIAYLGDGGGVIIPSTVETIGIRSFYGCTGLTSITIPNGVSEIGGAAFQGCKRLTSVYIPYGITTINWYTFAGCESLTSVSIPSSVTSIKNDAFSYCSKLTSILIPNSVTSIGSYAFMGCTGLTITIPDSVTSISELAFSDVRHIEYHGSATGSPWGALSMNGIKDGDFVFTDTTKTQLTAYTGNGGDVIIPSTVLVVGNKAFNGCYRLKTITIPSSVTSIGDGVFFGCSGLASVYCKATNPPEIGYLSFNLFDGYNYALRDILFPEIFVPCEYAATYQLAWNDYSSIIFENLYELEFNHAFLSNNDNMGAVRAPNVDCDSNITITAIANNGYQFSVWNDGNTDNPRIIHMTSDTVVTAQFVRKTYTIFGQVENDKYGIVEAEHNDIIYYGDLVTLSVTANYGYHFTQWNDGNADNPRQVQVTRDSIFTAQFGYNQYGITLAVDTTIHGCVNGAGSYNYLSERTISAMPNYGYHFTQWSDGDPNNPRVITLTQDTAFTALFAKNTYSIAALSADTVMGTVAGTSTLEYLDTATLTATSNYGYHFTQWSDGNTANPRSVQVIRDSVITAQFDYNQYSIALAVDTTIHGNVSGAGYYNYLSNRTITATPNYGYHFTMWSDGDTNNPRTLTLTRDTAFTALFAKNTYSIAALSADTVKGYVGGTGTLEYLDTATITATAHYGYHFTMWSDGNAANPRMVQVTRDSLFTAQFDYNQYSIALAVDTTIHGTVSGAGDYNYLSARTITATPNYGYHFTTWNDGDTNNPRTLTLTRDTAFTALFAKNTYNITALSADTVMGAVAGTSTLEYLDTAALTATANYGYHFTQWSDGNADNPRQVQVTRDSVFTAQFDYNQYSIALAVDTSIHGIVSGAGNYNYLSSRTISATANYGYHFTVWNDGDTNNPRTLTLTQDTAFMALFAKNTYSIAALSADTVMGAVAGTSTLEYLDTAALMATANYGYHFTQWSDGNTDNPRQVQVTHDSLFTAQFDYNQYSITLVVDTTIYGTVSGAGSYNYLSTRTITATPNYGYHFTQWSDGDTNNPRILTLTQDTAFTALFAKNTYSITALSTDTVMGAVAGTSTLEYLDTATLTATANYGYHFTQWSDGNTANPRQVQVTRDSVFTAQFDYNQYSIALSVDTTIHGSVSGAGSYNYLSERSITATANYGYMERRRHQQSTCHHADARHGFYRVVCKEYLQHCRPVC